MVPTSRNSVRSPRTSSPDKEPGPRRRDSRRRSAPTPATARTAAFPRIYHPAHDDSSDDGRCRGGTRGRRSWGGWRERRGKQADRAAAVFQPRVRGISTERAGDLASVTGRLVAEGVTEPIEFRQTRDFGDGVPVPWFDAILTTVEYDSFGAWAMEWRPEYFADPRGNTEPPSRPGDVGRERYLSDAYQDHLMRDVTTIRLAVTQRDLDSTVPLLRAGGFQVRSAPGGITARSGKTTIRFDVVPVHQVGLRQVDFSLNRSVGYRHTERIGRSTLVVGPGDHAVWTFPRTES
ncbi:DUF5829 family protein [Actinophytocola algeriensis]|nr:DUF5829 family protein [Actinophytocola algeriensis]